MGAPSDCNRHVRSRRWRARRRRIRAGAAEVGVERPVGFPIAICACEGRRSSPAWPCACEVRGQPTRRPLLAGDASRRLTCYSHYGVGGCLRRSGAAAATIVEQMEHVARWEQLRELGSHRSALADAVQLKIYPAGPDEMALPPDRATYGLAGEYTIPYGANGEAPNVFMHLKNTSDRDLHVALLDLTDRLECDVLYQTKTLAAGAEDNVNEKGGPMKLSLSAGSIRFRARRTQDWLKIVVSESPFEADAFELAAVGEQARSIGTPPRNMLELIAAEPSAVE